MAPGGRKPKRIALPKLRAAREARGWTEDDLAAAVLDVVEKLGEQEPRISGGQVSKWERGDRNPGLYYRARLCVALECAPDQLGFPATPTLVRSIRELMERTQESRRTAAEADRDAVAGQLDTERLRATLVHLWPVDRPLLEGLDRVARHLADRASIEPPAVMIPALSGHLDMLIELLSRPQLENNTRELHRIAALTGLNLAWTSWVSGNVVATTRNHAIAESLARESRSSSQLAMILVDRSEIAGRRVRSDAEWEKAQALADAAETAALMDPTTPSGVLAWIYGERSMQRAELGDEHGSGRDIERMEELRLSSASAELNIFSPDVPSTWVDRYHVRRALRVGRADEGLTISARVLAETDTSLHWERADTLIWLAEAWLMKEELQASVDRLREAIDLLQASGNAQDLARVRRLMNRMRQRWGRTAEVRELDEALRG